MTKPVKWHFWHICCNKQYGMLHIAFQAYAPFIHEYPADLRILHLRCWTCNKSYPTGNKRSCTITSTKVMLLHFHRPNKMCTLVCADTVNARWQRSPEGSSRSLHSCGLLRSWKPSIIASKRGEVVSTKSLAGRVPRLGGGTFQMVGIPNHRILWTTTDSSCINFDVSNTLFQRLVGHGRNLQCWRVGRVPRSWAWGPHYSFQQITCPSASLDTIKCSRSKILHV